MKSLTCFVLLTLLFAVSLPAETICLGLPLQSVTSESYVIKAEVTKLFQERGYEVDCDKAVLEVMYYWLPATRSTDWSDAMVTATPITSDTVHVTVTPRTYYGPGAWTFVLKLNTQYDLTGIADVSSMSLKGAVKGMDKAIKKHNKKKPPKLF